MPTIVLTPTARQVSLVALPPDIVRSISPRYSPAVGGSSGRATASARRSLSLLPARSPEGDSRILLGAIGMRPCKPAALPRSGDQDLLFYKGPDRVSELTATARSPDDSFGLRAGNAVLSSKVADLIGLTTSHAAASSVASSIRHRHRTLSLASRSYDTSALYENWTVWATWTFS